MDEQCRSSSTPLILLLVEAMMMDFEGGVVDPRFRLLSLSLGERLAESQRNLCKWDTR